VTGVADQVFEAPMSVPFLLELFHGHLVEVQDPRVVRVFVDDLIEHRAEVVVPIPKLRHAPRGPSCQSVVQRIETSLPASTAPFQPSGRMEALDTSRSADKAPLADTEMALRREFADQSRSRLPEPGPGSPVRVSDGSPRPTCVSTATRLPRTPTTVTPVTFQERT
jgi:hypothetical protein